MEVEIDWTSEPSNDLERRIRSEYLQIVIEEARPNLSGFDGNPSWEYSALCALQVANKPVASDLTEAIDSARNACEMYRERQRRAQHEAILDKAIARVGLRATDG